MPPGALLLVFEHVLRAARGSLKFKPQSLVSAGQPEPATLACTHAAACTRRGRASQACDGLTGRALGLRSLDLQRFLWEAALGSKVAANFSAATPRRSQRRDRFAKTPLCAAYKGNSALWTTEPSSAQPGPATRLLGGWVVPMARAHLASHACWHRTHLRLPQTWYVFAIRTPMCTVPKCTGPHR